MTSTVRESGRYGVQYCNAEPFGVWHQHDRSNPIPKGPSPDTSGLYAGELSGLGGLGGLALAPDCTGVNSIKWTSVTWGRDGDFFR